jgi:putative methionine-R-sulfoxide reductase with GAF domain
MKQKNLNSSTTIPGFLPASFNGLWKRLSFGQHRIQSRLTALVLIITLPLLVGTTLFISSRAGDVIEAQANTDLTENNDALAANVSIWLELHARTLQEMAMLPDIVSMDGERQRRILQVITASHPNLFLAQTTDLRGMNIARNDDSELKDYSDRGWFLGAKSGAPMTVEALISRTTGKPALNMSTPIRDASGKIVGVASIVSLLDEISQEVLSENEEGRATTFIVDDTNHVIAHPDPSYTEQELQDLSTYPPVVALRQGKTGLIMFTDENGILWRAYISALDNGWGIIAQQPDAELLAPVHQFQAIAILLILIGATLMSVLIWLSIRGTIQPIDALTETVSAIAAGDLNRVAEVKTQDEIGVLAATFNNMTSQLRELITNLEQHVSDRTKALTASAEVSRRVSTILDEGQLIHEVVEQVRAAFNYYHVHVYLLAETSGDLVMAGGTGEAGATMMASGHKIPKGKGLVGRSSEMAAPILIPDVSQDPDWLSNPLLPETQSEVAVPIAIGSRILGVLDVQHNLIDGLLQKDVELLQSIANQVAVALSNARSYTNIQKRAELEAQINSVSQKIQNATTVEGALQIAAQELGRILGAKGTRVMLEAPQWTSANSRRNAKLN